MSALIPFSSTSALPQQFSFSVGQYFWRDDVIFKIEETYPDNVVLRHAITLECKLVPLSQVYQWYLDQTLTPCTKDDVLHIVNSEPSLEKGEAVQLFATDIGAPAFLQASKLVRYIRALQSLGYKNLRPTNILELDYQHVKSKFLGSGEFKDGKHPSLWTIYRASLKLHRNDGDWRAVIPNYNARGGAKQLRVDDRVLVAFRDVASKLRSDKSKKIRYSKICTEIGQILRHQVTPDELINILPSASTVTRMVKSEFTAFEISARNKGITAAKKEFRNFYPRDRAEMPLEVVEYDDKDTRVYLVDERSGLPWGRAYVTSGIDQYSTVGLGFSISEHHRSSWSAMNAFANTLLPKDLAHTDFSYVRSDAEFFGLPGIPLFDNALYNHSNAMQRAVLDMSGRTMAWAKPYTPTEKSVVEDFNGQMERDFLPTLPGYGGPKKSRDQLEDGIASATMTCVDFRQAFFKWHYDVHCNTPRGGKHGGLTPRQKWHESMRSTTPRIPGDLHRIHAAVGIPHSVQLRPDGILFCGLAYQHPRLDQIARRYGAKFQITFRYNPHRLDKIYACDPSTSEYFVVPSTDLSYTGDLTLRQHKLIRKKLREIGERNPSRLQLMQHRNELVTLTSQLLKSAKLKERKWARKHLSVNAAGDPIETIVSTTEIITDLEYQISAIEDIQIESGDEGWNLPEDF